MISPDMVMQVAGAATQLVGAGLSFVQAAKQRKLQKEAQADAEAAMAQARKAIEINYYDILGVNKEPYELQREAMISQGQQAIQAAQEGDRGAAAAAGKVQMAMNEGQAQIRTQMGKEMQDIQKLQAGEESRLRDVGVQLDLQEVEGAQQAAADAQRAATQYTQAGITGITNLGKKAAEQAPLYAKGKSDKETPLNSESGYDAQSISYPGVDANGKPTSVLPNPFTNNAAFGVNPYEYADGLDWRYLPPVLANSTYTGIQNQ